VNLLIHIVSHILLKIVSEAGNKFPEAGKTPIRLLPFHLLSFYLRWFAYYDNLPTASLPARLGQQ